MRTFVALAALLALAACAQPAPPRDQFYRLAVASPEQTFDKPPLAGVVEVSRFSADGLTGERAIVFSFRDKPQSVQNYRFDFWNDPPSALLQDQLVSFLRAGRAADKVVTSDLRAPADHVVQGRIRRFEQIAGPRPAAIVELELGVTRIRGNRLILLENYRVEKAAADESVAAAVEAANVAVADIFRQFARDLARAE